MGMTALSVTIAKGVTRNGDLVNVAKYVARDPSTGKIVVTTPTPPTFFRFARVEADNVPSMARLLDMGRHYPHACMLLGEAINPDRHAIQRRLLKARPDTPATLRSAPRRWAILDMDGPEMPPGMRGVEEAFARPVDVVRHVKGLLPEGFRLAECAWAWTGSMGYRQDRKARLRLCFRLPFALHPGVLGLYFAEQEAPVDPASFRPVQPIYTAAAQRAPNILDPYPPSAPMSGVVDWGGGDARLPPANYFVELQNKFINKQVLGAGEFSQHQARGIMLSGHGAAPSVAELEGAIKTGGDGLHDALVAFTFRLFRSGMSRDEVLERAKQAMLASDAKTLTPARWQDRFLDLPRTVDGALFRTGGQTTEPLRGLEKRAI
jgi:hypothetical protein